MADTKITALTALTAADPANDVIPIVDISDTSMAASGTTKKISVNNILGASGTATLASATITGNLTVDTNTLFVDSANDRVGIGTASPSFAKLELISGDMRMSLNQSLYLYYGSATNYASLRTDNSGNVQIFTGLSSPANRFQIANDGVCTWSNVGGVAGTAMTLNATGLGVGASPANGKLIVGADATTDGNGSWNTTLRNTVGAATTAPKTGLAFSGYWNGTSNFANFAGISGGKENSTDANTAGILTMWTSPNGGSPTTRLTIDSAGNCGIGVTPSAWSSPYKAIEILGGNINTSSTSTIRIYQNAVVTASGLVYKTGGLAATGYVQSNGSHFFQNAGVGTNANDPLSLTTPMTLDASGNLGIGVTPVSRLTVSGGVSLTSAASNHFLRDGTAWIWSSDGASTGTARGGLYADGSSNLNLYGGSTLASHLQINSSGDVISKVNTSVPTVANSQMVFNLTTNTNLRITVRGTDGTLRSANITLAP